MQLNAKKSVILSNMIGLCRASAKGLRPGLLQYSYIIAALPLLYVKLVDGGLERKVFIVVEESPPTSITSKLPSPFSYPFSYSASPPLLRRS